jgi:hypothetical protein
VDGDAGRLVAADLALAGVEPGPHAEPELTRRVADGGRAAEGARRPVVADADPVRDLERLVGDRAPG